MRALGWWRRRRTRAIQAAAEVMASKLVSRDGLTGLPNRGVLEADLQGQVTSGRPGALLILDLDHFKTVNDRFGHPAGDEVLRTTAARLLTHLPATARAYRIGGDEFCVLLPDCEFAATMDAAEAMAKSLAEPMHVDGSLRMVTASIGLARTPRSKAHHVLAIAERALYQAKARGRGGVVTEDDLDELRKGRYDLVQQFHQLQDQRDALAVRAITDELTGLRNRRAFDSALLRLHAESERTASPFAVVYMDLDRFHDLNRARGDAAGDEALRACAQALAGACRSPADVVYRKGGEELVALLPGTDGAEAGRVAERMRLAVTAASVPCTDEDGSAVVTISGGYSAFDPALPRSADDVVGAANRAMVLAKEQGRDRMLEG